MCHYKVVSLQEPHWPWTYEYFLLSFARSRTARFVLRGFARITSFYLKYFDYFPINKPGSIDAAAGVYFMGDKLSTPAEDYEIIKEYHGAL